MKIPRLLPVTFFFAITTGVSTPTAFAETAASVSEADALEDSFSLNRPGADAHDQSGVEIEDKKYPGFGIYRSKRLDQKEFERRVLQEGIAHFVVLDGTAKNRESKFLAVLKEKYKNAPETDPVARKVRAVVVHDYKQGAHAPPSVEFLDEVDRILADAQSKGLKMNVRCRQGWHRTGRTMAYLKMKVAKENGKDFTAAEAYADLYSHARKMGVHIEKLKSPWKFVTDPITGKKTQSYAEALVPQVQALHDYLYSHACSVSEKNQKFCVAGANQRIVGKQIAEIQDSAQLHAPESRAHGEVSADQRDKGVVTSLSGTVNGPNKDTKSSQQVNH